MEIKEGDLIIADIKKIRKRDNSPQYIKLVTQTIKHAKGKLYVRSVKDGLIQASSWKYDPFDVYIPIESVVKVVGNDLNYKLK